MVRQATAITTNNLLMMFCLLEINEDTEHFTGVGSPLVHGSLGGLGLNLVTDKTVNRTGTTLQIMDNGTEVAGLGIA